MKAKTEIVTAIVTVVGYNTTMGDEISPTRKEKKYQTTANCSKGQDAKQAG